MTFDAEKSKLFGPIMAALAGFFSLGETATEAEIHDALQGVAPLKEQLEEAKTSGAASSAAELQTIKERLTTLEGELEALRSDSQAKDTRISELQVELNQHEENAGKATEALEAMKVQHKKEIQVLAGQVSSLKAGKPVEQEQQDGAHAADNDKKEAAGGIVPLAESDLKKYATKRRG